MYSAATLSFTVAGSSNGVNSAGAVALIGAIAVVLAASIPTLLSLREREPREITRLRHTTDAERHRAEQELRDTEAELEEAQNRVHDLERFIWTLGYDPDTKQRVTAGGGATP